MRETELLRALVAQYGKDSWKDVARFLPGRNSKSCSLKWRNDLDPAVRRPSSYPFTRWEDAVIVAAQREYGNEWRQIAAHLDRRSNTHIKNRFNCHLSKPEKTAELLRENAYLAHGMSLADLMGAQARGLVAQEAGPTGGDGSGVYGVNGGEAAGPAGDDGGPEQEDGAPQDEGHDGGFASEEPAYQQQRLGDPTVHLAATPQANLPLATPGSAAFPSPAHGHSWQQPTALKRQANPLAMPVPSAHGGRGGLAAGAAPDDLLEGCIDTGGARAGHPPGPTPSSVSTLSTATAHGFAYGRQLLMSPAQAGPATYGALMATPPKHRVLARRSLGHLAAAGSPLPMASGTPAALPPSSGARGMARAFPSPGGAAGGTVMGLPMMSHPPMAGGPHLAGLGTGSYANGFAGGFASGSGAFPTAGPGATVPAASMSAFDYAGGAPIVVPPMLGSGSFFTMPLTTMAPPPLPAQQPPSHAAAFQSAGEPVPAAPPAPVTGGPAGLPGGCEDGAAAAAGAGSGSFSFPASLLGSGDLDGLLDAVDEEFLPADL
ncbi:MAG: hypothetical protein J3K34DRAFT_494139 [Monoraphidium minutum]|nr:MAG: hypothetical protein J3K34DRAFT_494139 [Monoraphidium minutum]